MSDFVPWYYKLEFSATHCDTPKKAFANNSVALSFLRCTTPLNLINVAMGTLVCFLIAIVFRLYLQVVCNYFFNWGIESCSSVY